MDNDNKDAGLQSDEQQDLGIEVPVEETQTETPQDHKDEDPSDKLTPDHPRFKDVLDRAKTAEDRAEELAARIEELENRSTRTPNEEEELSEIERASLEKIKRHLAKDGFVRQDDLQVTRNADNLRKLGEKHDGSDGLPKFDRVDIVAYAKQNGFGNNFEAAYKDMHHDAILNAEISKRMKAPTPPASEKPTGGAGTPGTKRLTPAEIAKLPDEEYEKYRTGILTAIRPK